jgi:hypothetical protein
MIIKLITILIIALTLITFSIFEFIDGFVFSGLALILTAILSAWIIITGISEHIKNDGTKFVILIITGLSIAQVIQSSSLFDFDQAQKNADLLTQSIEVGYCTIENQPNEKLRQAFDKLKDVLMEKCAIQNYDNAADFIINIQKARLLDPATGAIDTIYNQLKGKKNITCIDIAKQLNELCPGKFKL